jgi:hypothetical protein
MMVQPLAAPAAPGPEPRAGPRYSLRGDDGLEVPRSSPSHSDQLQSDLCIRSKRHSSPTIHCPFDSAGPCPDQTENLEARAPGRPPAGLAQARLRKKNLESENKRIRTWTITPPALRRPGHAGHDSDGSVGRDTPTVTHCDRAVTHRDAPRCASEPDSDSEGQWGPGAWKTRYCVSHVTSTRPGPRPGASHCPGITA